MFTDVHALNAMGGQGRRGNLGGVEVFFYTFYALPLSGPKNCFLISFVKKSRSVSNLGTFANLKLEVQFQFSGKFPASCHQQQTGKVIISSQECLTINNIKRIQRNVTKYIFLFFLCKICFFYIFFALFPFFI